MKEELEQDLRNEARPLTKGKGYVSISLNFNNRVDIDTLSICVTLQKKVNLFLEYY